MSIKVNQGMFERVDQDINTRDVLNGIQPRSVARPYSLVGSQGVPINVTVPALPSSFARAICDVRVAGGSGYAGAIALSAGWIGAIPPIQHSAYLRIQFGSEGGQMETLIDFTRGAIVTVPAQYLRAILEVVNPAAPLQVSVVGSCSLAPFTGQGKHTVSYVLPGGGAALAPGASTGPTIPAFARRFKVFAFDNTSDTLLIEAVGVGGNPIYRWTMFPGTECPWLNIPADCDAFLITNAGAVDVNPFCCMFELDL
jgi:hypothetical protein